MNNPINHFGFNPKNYKWLYIGLAINVLGYILMIGGGAESLNEFKEEELFSPIRITLSPILIIAGYVVILFSIMRVSKMESLFIADSPFQRELNFAAQIIRKYNLGNKEYFLTVFNHVDNSLLEIAWNVGSKKIQNKEIIKDSSNLTPVERNEVKRLYDEIAESPKEILRKILDKEFDVKKYKLSDEKIERSLRNSIAKRYIELISKNISE
jgi:hypothetical protein